MCGFVSQLKLSVCLSGFLLRNGQLRFQHFQLKKVNADGQITSGRRPHLSHPPPTPGCKLVVVPARRRGRFFGGQTITTTSPLAGRVVWETLVTSTFSRRQPCPSPPSAPLEQPHSGATARQVARQIFSARHGQLLAAAHPPLECPHLTSGKQQTFRKPTCLPEARSGFLLSQYHRQITNPQAHLHSRLPHLNIFASRAVARPSRGRHHPRDASWWHQDRRRKINFRAHRSR